MSPAIGLTVIGAIGIVLLGVMPKAEVDTTTFEQDIYAEVVSDAIQQYQLTQTHGKALDRCVQAGLVAQAYLQAGDGTNYENWNRRAESDCRAAGM